ncbi:MAG: lipocalin family protein [Bdellovibrio sp.]|nr:lipocalin family protein [Bdellovibrio sp.]
MNFTHTVDYVDTEKFMGKWYVWAGRTTFLEKNCYSSTETYTWNKEKERIDISFNCRKGDFDGALRSIPQKAWIENKTTQAHWKVQPWWPLKFDYLIIDLDPNYEWTAIGVPNGAYLWIMGRNPIASDQQINQILKRIQTLEYPVEKVKRVPQR